MKLADILDSTNIAEMLDKTELAEISEEVLRQYDADVESRIDWQEAYIKWLSMTGQKIEHKTTPWPGAANVKYPLMTEAALQFNARAMPALLPNNSPVGAGPIGPDPDGQKRIMADAVAKHMNYQVVTEMEEWEEEFDALLMAIAISGMEYKKTYYDHQKGRNVSRHITPLNLVVNYYADKLENSRKTEIHRWTKNFIMEKVAAGVFSEIDWDTQPDPHTGKESDAEADNKERSGLNEPGQVDSATPYTVLEYHGWYDLDEDGYEEPYIITMMEDSREILQIVPRFEADDVEISEDGRIIRIQAAESYTKFGFIPNPDGSFYDIGFGTLLYPINAVVNTTINMMLDAGASSIMNSGFVGRGMKMRGGMFTMAPNTWLTVNSTGDDIRKSFVPMPTKEPSMVVYSLMQYMVEAGKRISSTTDIFTGEMPGQNTKTGVTQAVRDEGQKVFTAIYKRLRRALKSELDKLYELNGIILSVGEAAQNTLIVKSAQIFGIDPQWYSKELMNIQPSSDPNIAVKEQQMQKDMTVMQTIQGTGIGDLAAAQKRLLTTLEVERVEEVQPEGSAPPPDPKAQLEQQEQQMQSSQADFDASMKEKEFQLEVWKTQTELKIAMAKVMVDSDKSAQELGIAQAELEFKINAEREGIDERREAAANAANARSVGGMET